MYNYGVWFSIWILSQLLPWLEETVSGEISLWTGVPIDNRSIRISVPPDGAMP